MNIVIDSEKQYLKNLERFNEIFHVSEGTPEFEEKKILGDALIKYETDIIIDRKIKEVVVTYHDTTGWWIFKRHTKRVFTPLEWEHFGEKIKKIAKDVKVVMTD